MPKKSLVRSLLAAAIISAAVIVPIQPANAATEVVTQCGALAPRAAGLSDLDWALGQQNYRDYCALKGLKQTTPTTVSMPASSSTYAAQGTDSTDATDGVEVLDGVDDLQGINGVGSGKYIRLAVYDKNQTCTCGSKYKSWTVNSSVTGLPYDGNWRHTFSLTLIYRVGSGAWQIAPTRPADTYGSIPTVSGTMSMTQRVEASSSVYTWRNKRLETVIASAP